MWEAPVSSFTQTDNWHKAFGAGYVTTASLQWEIGKVGSGLLVVVHEGFAFDVSVPWFARWAFNPTDTRYRKAAALHDWALSEGWDRVAAAALFNDALNASGVGGVERLAMTIGVILWRWS